MFFAQWWVLDLISESLSDVYPDTTPYSLGLDGCEVCLCVPCARVRPPVPCVSRVCPGSPRCLLPDTLLILSAGRDQPPTQLLCVPFIAFVRSRMRGLGVGTCPREGYPGIGGFFNTRKGQYLDDILY